MLRRGSRSRRVIIGALVGLAIGVAPLVIGSAIMPWAKAGGFASIIVTCLMWIAWLPFSLFTPVLLLVGLLSGDPESLLVLMANPLWGILAWVVIGVLGGLVWHWGMGTTEESETSQQRTPSKLRRGCLIAASAVGLAVVGLSIFNGIAFRAGQSEPDLATITKRTGVHLPQSAVLVNSCAEEYLGYRAVARIRIDCTEMDEYSRSLRSTGEYEVYHITGPFEWAPSVRPERVQSWWHPESLHGAMALVHQRQAIQMVVGVTGDKECILYLWASDEFYPGQRRQE